MNIEHVFIIRLDMIKSKNNKEDFLVDCIISAGELDKSGHRFLDNDLKVYEVVKHNVPYSEFLKWNNSIECLNRILELEKIGRERFGDEYYMKYIVCHYCTSPKKD